VNALVEALRARADAPVLVTGQGETLTGSTVLGAADRVAARLETGNAGTVATLIDNGPAWLTADVACQLAGVAHVPVPSFFSAEQLAHVLTAAAVDTVITDRVAGLPQDFGLETFDGLVIAQRAGRPRPVVSAGTAKITFTSGTTGSPKGVCLSQDQLDAVAAALAERVRPLGLRRHLVTLPLAVLLENVAGVQAGLMAGSELVFPAPGGTGLEGSSGFDARALIATIDELRPDSLILLPQMLKALVAVLRAEGRRLDGLAFVAVGGARTSPELLREARSLGVPAFEGYGLSECGSVVSLNVPGEDRPGTVGRVLPHVDLRLGPDGEVLVRGREAVRYVGEASPSGEWYDTGDVGYMDQAGYLTLLGRRRNVLITGFGRNVSPEWVESELLSAPEIAQALVFGDDLPGLCALLVPAPGIEHAALQRALVRVNRRLPDYARIITWEAAEPFRSGEGEMTVNGRPCRKRIMEGRAAMLATLEERANRASQGDRSEPLRQAH
jgi:long-subunit acyl-CoA synthetase (AMP-forming)